ncbi:toxin ParE1/3/4 [Paraburkholderia sp. GAS32]
MVQTQSKLLILERHKRIRKICVATSSRASGAEMWKQTSTQLTATFGNIRQFPQRGYVPAEFSDFGGLNFREALSGRNRVIFEVRDGTIYIHCVADTRRGRQM